MTYVNRLYDESDISQLDIEMEVFNVAPADSMLYLQLYDGDCGDAGNILGGERKACYSGHSLALTILITLKLDLALPPYPTRN
jgi:hypothetical protein